MIDNPLPASPLSGGGALPQFSALDRGGALPQFLALARGESLPQFPPLTRGGLGWGCLKSLAYALSRNLSPTLIAQYQLQLPDKKLIQAKLHELLEQDLDGER